MALELWGKARSYLESSIAMSPTADSYALYGRLLNQFGEESSAALAFSTGLGLVTGAVDELPALDAPSARTARDKAEPVDGGATEVESGANPTTR